MNTMKRLFVAVELPEMLRNKIHALAAELPQDGIKAVEKENIHVTLKFLGDTPSEKIREIEEKLQRISFSPFHCLISGVGVFPNPNYIRVVWVGLQCMEMQKLAAETEKALAGFGKEEDHPFSAHITIARVKGKIDVTQFLAKHANESFGEMSVSEFVLMESRLASGGPAYTVLKRFSLEK